MEEEGTKKKDKYDQEKGQICSRKRTNISKKRTNISKKGTNMRFTRKIPTALSNFLPNGGGGHKEKDKYAQENTCEAKYKKSII